MSRTSGDRLAAPATGRLTGLDAACGLAVPGMFVAHVNPYQTFPDSTVQALVSGRSAGLFAVRAVLLFCIGLALSALDVPVEEILTAYGALFLLALTAGLGHGLLVLTVTGVYPLPTWLPFLLAGMAVGRLPLGDPSAARSSSPTGRRVRSRRSPPSAGSRRAPTSVTSW